MRSPGFILSFLIVLFAQGQNIPKWVRMKHAVDIPELRIGNSNNGYYYMVFDEQYNTQLKENFYHYAYKITSEAGTKECSQIEASYDPNYQKVEWAVLCIIRNGKVINKLDPSKFQVLNEETERHNGLLYNRKTIYRNLEDVRSGDIVELAYTVKGYKDFFENKFSQRLSLQYSEELGYISYRFVFDKKNRPAISVFNSDIQFEADSSGNNLVYDYQIQHSKALIIEENYPSWFDPYPYAVFTTYKNWLECKKLNKKIVFAKQDDKRLLKDLHSELCANCSSQEEKLTRIADYVQNSIRYNGKEYGIHTHVAHSPDEVVKNLYGDCKDKSMLMCELLALSGVKAYPALLSTDYKKEVENLPPGHLWFNHCIVAIENGKGKYRFIDPTITFQGGSFTQRQMPFYESAMVLDDKDEIFSPIPEPDNSFYEVSEKFILIAGTSDAELSVTSIYQGANADNIRAYFKENSIPKAQVSFKDFYSKYDCTVEVADTISFADFPDSNKCIVTEKYMLRGFWKPADASVSKNIEKDFLPYSLNEYVTYAESETRQFPLQLSYPANLKQTIEIWHESGWNVSPATFESNNKHFNYKYETQVDGKTLKLIYTLKNREKYVQPQDYAGYKTQTDKVNLNMVFSSVTRVDGKSNNKGVNYFFYIIVICGLVISAGIIYYIGSMNFQSSFPKKYETIGGWLILVAINLVLSPILLVPSIIQGLQDSFSMDFTETYFYKGSTLKEYICGICDIAINVLNIFLFIISIYLAVIFFRRKSSFRLIYVGAKIFYILFIALNICYLEYYNSGLNSDNISRTIDQQWFIFSRIVINFLIWGSYVWFSERSRHTFTDKPDEGIYVLSGRNF